MPDNVQKVMLQIKSDLDDMFKLKLTNVKDIQTDVQTNNNTTNEINFLLKNDVQNARCLLFNTVLFEVKTLLKFCRQILKT